MNKNKILFFLLSIFLMVFYSCRDDFDKFERPEWLLGKLYTQILDSPDLGTFAKCLELTGYHDIINVSGSYTVFAPTDEAFNTFLAENPNYSSIQDIPLKELDRIVKYHIVQNPWTKKQLRSLDVYGWIDSLDINNDKPRGFKRSTLLLENNRKYGIGGRKATIVDTLSAEFSRTVMSDSRKYAPIFFSEYLDISNLTSQDYEFYFERPFEGGQNLYFANAKIISDEIKAENGIVYQVDEVVTPLNNAYQIIEKNKGGQSYSQFLNLLNEFPLFEYNKEETFDQAGAEQGMEVDSLFDLTFPELTFDIASERTKPPTGTYGLPSNVTTRYHHGMLAPTDQAYTNFVNEYFSIPGGWGSLDGAPEHIRRIIANTYLSFNSIYPSNMEKGFINGEMDEVKIAEAHVIHKEFGSNCSFIGLNEAVVPRAFSSVTGPVYLKRGFSKVMYAIERTKLLPTLKRKNKNYMFFVESDANTSIDSSLVYSQIKKEFLVISTGEDGNFTEFKLSNSSLRTLLLNHIGLLHPKGVARREFVPNMAGNYLVVNNETGEISGTAPSTFGFDGSEIELEFPTVLSSADNGTTYSIQNWFSFTSTSIFSKISGNFPEFHELLRKAGLTRDKEYRYSFINESELYTIFIPSVEAIESAGLQSLPKEELKNILLTHFVRGSLIFTDGNMDTEYYGTARIDERSTPFSTIFSKIYIEPGIDQISFRGKEGGIFTSLYESKSTNILTGLVVNADDDTEEVFPSIINNAVIHQIDKVLSFKELDTK